MSDYDFDLFLAHNSLDKAQIRAIAARLKQRKLRPWIDEEQILAGRSFQNMILYAVPRVRAAAVFVGPNGLGEWQQEEVEMLMDKCKKENKPLFLVRLPGLKEIPQELGFLEQKHWVSFDPSVNQALNDIESAIQGKPVDPFFDTLLCYKEEDAPEVRRIESQLKEAQIHTWRTGLSESSLQLAVLRELDPQLARIWSIAVFVGQNGGPWENDIIADLILEFREDHRPVIPVVLNTVLGDELRLPVYLRRLGRVDFRNPEPNPLNRLLQGITGEETYLLAHST